jgi:hypothetical protein
MMDYIRNILCIAFRREFLHQVLKLAKIRWITFVKFYVQRFAVEFRLPTRTYIVCNTLQEYYFVYFCFINNCQNNTMYPKYSYNVL